MKGAIALFDVGWTFYRHYGIIYSLLKVPRPQIPKLEPNAHERFKKNIAPALLTY
jgi:xanthosine utilization system XapX-like protein